MLSAVGLYGEQSLMLYNKDKQDLKISAKTFGDTKFMHLNAKHTQLALWKPIISNKNYPKVDPMYILLQRKLRKEEGKPDENKVHKAPNFPKLGHCTASAEVQTNLTIPLNHQNFHFYLFFNI